jgi:hypothetical protein
VPEVWPRVMPLPSARLLVPPHAAKATEAGASLWPTNEAPQYAGLAEAVSRTWQKRLLAPPHAGVKSWPDNPAQFFPNEEPQYPALTQAIIRAQRLVHAEFQVLREDWFEVLELTDPAKGVASGLRARLNQPMNQFLRFFAGEDRSEEGYASSDAEDGLLQQALLAAEAAGRDRAQSLLGIAGTGVVLTELARQGILRASWQRLTRDDGRFRFEVRLGEIRDAVLAMLGAGERPEAVARKLGRDLTGYERGRLEGVTQTEMAFAAEGAIRQVFREQGVVYVTVEGNPNTDEGCTMHFGQKYRTSESWQLPPYHTNCQCSVIPWPGDEEAAALVVSR